MIRKFVAWLNAKLNPISTSKKEVPYEHAVGMKLLVNYLLDPRKIKDVTQQEMEKITELEWKLQKLTRILNDNGIYTKCQDFKDIKNPDYRILLLTMQVDELIELCDQHYFPYKELLRSCESRDRSKTPDQFWGPGEGGAEIIPSKYIGPDHSFESK